MPDEYGPIISDKRESCFGPYETALSPWINDDYRTSEAWHPVKLYFHFHLLNKRENVINELSWTKIAKINSQQKKTKTKKKFFQNIARKAKIQLQGRQMLFEEYLPETKHPLYIPRTEFAEEQANEGFSCSDRGKHV